MTILEMIKTKEVKRATLLDELVKAEDAEVRAATHKLMTELDTEIADLKAIAERSTDVADPELEKRAADPVGELTEVKGASLAELRAKEVKDPAVEELEKRGADLKAGKAVNISARAITLASAVAVVEKKYSRELNDKFNEVSSLVDRVNAVPLQGGESYTKGFAVSGGEGDYTAEGADYADVDVKYDYVEIAKAKVTAYAETTKEMKKLPNVQYAAYIQEEVRKAIRKKITKQIIAGAGTANTICGIYNAPTKVIPADYDLEVAAIDANTLNDIVFSYGGEEDVEEDAVLILNKADLKAFADVRGDNAKAVYKITKNGNTGTLGYAEGGVEVTYIINSACTALSTASTAVNTMVYGRLGAYELPIFSDIEIEESSEFKFKQGIIAYRAEAFVGGNVAAYKGWMRIKKQIAG